MSERLHSDAAFVPPAEPGHPAGSPPPASPRIGRSMGRSVWRHRTAIGIGSVVLGVAVAGIALQFLSGSPSAAQQADPATRPNTARAKNTYVARVGKQLVTEDELARECMERHGREVLENIVNRTIIQQACSDAGITVSEAEVGNEIRNIAKRFNIPVDTWLKMLQEERGLTPAQYARDVIWPMLALKKLARTDIDVTEDNVKLAFNRDYGPRVKAKMIMFDNLRRAQGIWEEVVKTPGDFERLARQHSIEPNSRSLGGSIPPIRWKAGNDALEKAAFKLKPGEISGIVQVGYNRYVVLLCEGRTEPIVTNIEDVREELTELIREEKIQQAVARRFDEIKQATRVDNYLTNTSTGGNIQQTSADADSAGVSNAAGRATIGDQAQPVDPARRAAREAAPLQGN
jgi:foldase protein PrsA